MAAYVHACFELLFEGWPTEIDVDSADAQQSHSGMRQTYLTKSLIGSLQDTVVMTPLQVFNAPLRKGAIKYVSW